MRKTFLILGFLFLALGATVFAETGLDEALALFTTGADVMVNYDAAGRARLEAAIDAFEDALGIAASFDAANEDAYSTLEISIEKKDLVNKLSQCYYTLGDVFLRGQDSAETIFVKGQYWGLKSLRMNPEFVTEEKRHGFIEAVAQEADVAALYWTYANWARKDEIDKLGAIARNDPPKLLAMAEQALAVDETYIAYGPYRSLAAFWGGLPPFPLITFGQNLPRALSYICPVVYEPGYCVDCPDCPYDQDCNAYFENRLIFAEYYLMEKGLWEEAARVLQSILDDPVGETYSLYNALCQELATNLLEEVQEHL
jgi:tetratricopeptide (TPR) repeat protein